MVLDMRTGSLVERFHMRITGNSVGSVIVHNVERSIEDGTTRGLHLPAVTVRGIFRTPSIKRLVASK